MSWGVNEEAIGVMSSADTKLVETYTSIHEMISTLRQTFDENKSGLGKHTDQIQQLLDELEAAEAEGSAPVKKLVLKLTKAIAIRRQHIDGGYSVGRSR